MDVKRKIVPVNFYGENLKIETTLFGSDLKSNHRKIFLSHGFTMHPKDYTKFAELLYEKSGKELTIVAPKIVGHKIKGYNNNSFNANQEIYESFRDEFGYHGDIISHSAGPNQYETDKLVMVNPLMPFEQNVVQFMRDVSLKYSNNDLKAMIGSKKGWGLAYSFMKNMDQNLELIMDWQGMDLDNMFPERPNTDGRVIVAGSGSDNYMKDNLFDYVNLRNNLGNKFKSYDQALVPLGDHASIMLHPEEVAQKTIEFLL